MREQILLDAFIKATECMDVSPIELDQFLHEGFYDKMGSTEHNINHLERWLKNRVDFCVGNKTEY